MGGTFTTEDYRCHLRHYLAQELSSSFLKLPYVFYGRIEIVFFFCLLFFFSFDFILLMELTGEIRQKQYDKDTTLCEE